MRLISDTNLDAVLAGTGLSSKTKSLRVYANSACNGNKIAKKIAKVYARVVEAGVPESDALPVTLIMVNREYNGASLSHSHAYRFDCDSASYSRMYANNDSIMDAYRIIKTKTIEKWRAAIEAIDTQLAKNQFDGKPWK